MSLNAETRSTLPPDVSTGNLLADLANPDRDVRQVAVIALGERADPATADALVAQLFAEPDFFVRDTLTWAVTRLGASALPAVLAGLDEQRAPEVRTQALHTLSKIADPATVNAIVTLIDDDEPAVSAKARWALGRIGDPRVVPQLADRLGANTTEVQNALTDVLASFGSGAVPTLVDALGHSDAAVRQHAADVLCHVGHPDAEPAAHALGEAAADPESAVAVSAVMALGELEGPEAERALERAAELPDARVSAVAARLAGRRKRSSKLRAALAARRAEADRAS
jgi:HEAT repeat protein